MVCVVQISTSGNGNSNLRLPEVEAVEPLPDEFDPAEICAPLSSDVDNVVEDDNVAVENESSNDSGHIAKGKGFGNGVKREIVLGKNIHRSCFAITEPEADDEITGEREAYMASVLARYRRSLVERTKHHLGCSEVGRRHLWECLLRENSTNYGNGTKLLLWLVLVHLSFHGVLCINKDGVALIAFKTAILQDPQKALSNWNASDDTPCAWNGVSCMQIGVDNKELRVVGLSFPKKQLVGKKAASSPLLWAARLKIAKGVAKGLAYLHDCSPKKYVHGDLKPTNILLGLNMEPYIADFGLGRLANIAGALSTRQHSMIGSVHPESKQSLETQCAPVPPAGLVAQGILMSPGSSYQAPEAPKILKPTQKWDVYSFGVILLELLSGKSPTIQVASSEMDLVRWVQLCIEEKKPLPDVLDPVLVEELHREEEILGVLKIALACVQGSPDRRPSMKHVAELLEIQFNTSTRMQTGKYTLNSGRT